jgi:hypothetical protein
MFSVIPFLLKWLSAPHPLFSALLMLSMKECKHLHHQKQIASYYPECPGMSSQKQELTPKNGSG